MEQVYIAARRTGDSIEELQHYGVLGMKWGVRRARKQLSSATTQKQRDEAINSLNKHRAKGTVKVQKLEKKHVQLQKDVDRHVTKSDEKAAKLYRKSARLKNKAYGRFTSQDKSEKLIFKANKLNAKADNIKARSDAAKAKLAKNEKMTELFKKEINNIDKALVDKGRQYVNG